MRKEVVAVKQQQVLLLAFSIVFVGFLAASSLKYTGMVVGGCVDSDGNDIYTQGKVSITGDLLQDYCTEDAVVEFLCASDNLKFSITPCAGGCQEGTCIKKPEVVLGERYVLGAAGNLLELNEPLGDVVSTLTESDLHGLGTGKVRGASQTEYRQYLRFENGFTSGKAVFGENEHNDIGDFLFFSDGQTIFEYNIDFSEGWESEVNGNQLRDLIGEKIALLGKNFMVADAQKSGNQIELSFLRGDVTLLLEEGSQRTINFNGKEIPIEVLIIQDTAPPAVTFIVDGVRTEQLEEGESYRFADGEIGVASIMNNEAGEGSQDLVEIFLGSQLISVKDTDVTDSSFYSGGLEVDGNGIGEAQIMIKGQNVGSDFEITSIDYRLTAEASSGGDVFIAPGFLLSDEIRHAEALFESIDIGYDGLTDQSTSVMKLDPAGNTEYELSFENAKGDVLEIPFVIAQNGLSFGDESRRLLFIEAANSTNYTLRVNDFAVLTHRNDRSGITSAVQYRSIDTSNKVVEFDELGVGVTSVTYQGTEGVDASGTLNVGGNSYRFYIGPSPYSLAMDFTSDGALNGGEAKIVIQGGGIFDLGNTNEPNGNFTITLTTQGSQLDSGGSDEVISFGMLNSGGNVDIDVPNQSSLMRASDKDGEYAMSRYGVSISKDDDDPDGMMVEYPLKQRGVQVHVDLPVHQVSVQEQPTIISGPSITCFDGVKNAGEEGVDCGGPCPDCEVSFAPPKKSEATCFDGMINQDEDGIDCGGVCVPCTRPTKELPAPLKKYGTNFFSRFWYGLRWLFGSVD